ncbi:MAG: transposase [Elusimicrobiota bacterium]
MPRQARLDIPGALHHIMLRGSNKSKIFCDDQDRNLFIQRLGNNISEAACKVYAWALMGNHAHILFKSGQKGISTVMRRLLTGYAIYFNRKYKRSGHLFENRYKSILCEEDKYLLSLIRYIHLNPVRAKIITNMKQLDLYSWTGHRAIIGTDNYPWMDIKSVLWQFSTRENTAKTAYRKFVEEGITDGRKPELTGGGLIRSQGGWSQVLSMRQHGQREEYDERILGSGEFVSAVLKETDNKLVRQLKLCRKNNRTSIDKIMEEECNNRGINRKELENGSRRKKISKARAAIAQRGIEELGLSAAEIARHLGVNTSSIIRAIKKN